MTAEQTFGFAESGNEPAHPHALRSPRRPWLQQMLLLCGFSGLLFVFTFLLLGILAPHYHSMRDTISALEMTSLGALQRANFLVFGILLCAFAVALRVELRTGWSSVAIPAFQFITGLAVIGDAIFIYNPMHLVCDLVAFISALIVLFGFAARFRHEPDWRGWRAISVLAALVMIAFLTGFGFANHLGGPAGFLEKMASATRTLWSVLFTARLLSGKFLSQVPPVPRTWGPGIPSRP